MGHLHPFFHWRKSCPQWLNSATFPRGILVLALLVLAVFGAVPGYWQRTWSWSDKLPLADNGKSLTLLRDQGLMLPGWRSTRQKTTWIGSNRWSVQELIRRDRQKISILLRPQVFYRNQPEVEWTDVDGEEKWKSDSFQTLEIPVDTAQRDSKPIITRYFRAWNRRQTFAVVQWYAWLDGGHYAPNRWFWSDQWAQLHGTRQPWVAVCLKIPMEPLGNLANVQPFAQEIAKIVQSSLVAGPLSSALGSSSSDNQ